MVAMKKLIYACVDLLEWIIHHSNAEKCLLNNKYGECIGVFLLIEVIAFYKLKDVEVRLNIDFILEFYECRNNGQFLTS
jgi:hypothetical protein